MVPTTRALLLLGLIAALTVPPAAAKIHHSIVQTDDRKLIPLTDAFGFADGGRIDITIKDIAVYVQHDVEKDLNLEDFGFFLSPVEADAALEQDLADDSKCILTEIDNLFTFKDSAIRGIIQNKGGNVTFHFIVENGGLFYLYFANCERATPVSFDSQIEMYNVNERGARNYLSVGETELEAVYWVGCSREGFTMFMLQ
jgi:hypothetical protein